MSESKNKFIRDMETIIERPGNEEVGHYVGEAPSDLSEEHQQRREERRAEAIEYATSPEVAESLQKINLHLYAARGLPWEQPKNWYPD